MKIQTRTITEKSTTVTLTGEDVGALIRDHLKSLGVSLEGGTIEVRVGREEYDLTEVSFKIEAHTSTETEE